MSKICKGCQEHIEKGFTYVEGEGRLSAPYLLLGEAPGATEDKEGRPFIGRSGTLLQEIFKEVGIDRDLFYITNAVRCRPDKKNSTPSIKWVRECRDVCLQQTLESLKSLECIICLGLTPWKSITDDGQRSLIRDRRKVEYLKGIPAVCTYHPSYILRNPNARDWMIADLESYIIDKSYKRSPLSVEWELV